MKRTTSQEDLFLNVESTIFDKISVYWYRLVWNHIRNWYYECKYGFQRMFRGYDDRQIFNLDLELMKHIHKILKAFRKECVSHPDQMTYREWLATLDKMILYFQEANPETCSLINDIEYEVSFRYKRQENGFFELEVVYPTNEDKEKKELYLKKEKEIFDYQTNNLKRGMELLSTYFKNLWE